MSIHKEYSNLKMDLNLENYSNMNRIYNKLIKQYIN
jgi:hypothetical protein